MLNFSTAFSGLRVAQRAIDVIATNMTNINTEGYHRQEVDLRPVGFNHLGNVAIGGVEIAQVRRLADTFLDREISRQQSTLSQAREELNLLQTAESAFGQIGAEGMSSTIGNFFNSLTELTADPTSIPLSMQVIWAADALAGGFRNLSQFVQNLSDQIDPMVEGSLNEINMLAEEVADLNKQITVISMQGGSTNLLKDRRDQAIHELAELAEVRITEDPGRPEGLCISIWGKPLVVGATAFELESGLNSEQKLGIASVGSSIYATTVSGGRIGAMLALKNDLLPGIMDNLNTLAGEIITQINRLHVQGVGSSGAFSQSTGTSIESGIIDSWSTNITSGTFYVRVTDTTTKVVTRSEISVDVSTDTAADIAGRLDAIVGLSSTFANSVLTITADAGYEFDFLPAVSSEPYTDSITGAADPVISGIYTGEANQVFTGKIVGDGEVGVDDDLFMEVYDAGANLVKRLNIGEGYAVGDPLDIGNGLVLEWSVGQLNNNDEFTIQGLRDSDPTGFLAAAGINTLFSGDSALNMGVREEILNQPELLATSVDSGGIDGVNIRRMAEISQQNLTNLEDTNPQDYFNLLVTELGQTVVVRQARTASLENIMQQLNKRRDEISGVDLNEEASRLIVFERMFQAMAKVITTQDRALMSLMEIV